MSRIDEGIKPMLEVLQNYITNTGFEAVKSLPAKDQKVKISFPRIENWFPGTKSLYWNFTQSLWTI